MTPTDGQVGRRLATLTGLDAMRRSLIAYVVGWVALLPPLPGRGGLTGTLVDMRVKGVYEDMNYTPNTHWYLQALDLHL